uniref:Prominin-like protein n=1 Tax=Timema cristinae TaxID=61476 RepID=A0A7R9CNN4_TIMCR|nr:unnamed protein product [Timema cristinae]
MKQLFNYAQSSCRCIDRSDVTISQITVTTNELSRLLSRGRLASWRALGVLLAASKYMFVKVRLNGTRVKLETALNAHSQSELLDALSTHWKPILSHYAGVVGVTAVGLLFAVLLPLVGLFVCCCRCAGRCGARSQPFEKKRDPCRRITLGIFLSAITIVILFGVVCAFVTNQYMEDGIKQLPSRLRTGLSDTDLYLDNTNKEFTNLLVTNYEELQSTLITVLNNAGKTVQAQLKEASNATILTNLTNLVDTLNIIKDDMSNISYYVATLQSNTAELNSTLGGVKSELERILAQCQVLSDCRQLLEKAKNLSAANFDELPSINNSLVIVNDLFSNENGPGLVDSIKNSQTDFEDLQKQVQEHIDDKIPEIKNTMSQAGDSIKVIADKISSVLNTTRSYVSSTNSYLEVGQKYIKQYSPYRYYMDVALSSTLLLILLCLTLGLFFGFCGKRPDEYGGDCCTRGTGARFLITAVVFMFLFSIFLMVATLVHFLLGVVGEKLICETLKKPNNNQVLSWIDQQVNTNNLYPNGTNANIKLSSIIIHAAGTCRQHLAGIRCGDQIQHLRNDLKTLTFTFNANFSILPSATKNKLKDLKSSFSSFNFLEFDKMTQLALQLRNQSAILKDLQGRLVQEMTVTVQDLKNKTAALQEDIKFNHSSLDVAIEELITNVESAEDYIRQNGSNTINNLVTEFLDTFVVFIRSYLNRVIDNVLHKVGLSGPLATAYNSAIVSSCNQVLDPFNGFWASIGWSLILFIPAIVLCLMLASLYSKSDPYPGPLVESEYLYDAYADRDNIPLANVHDKKAHHRRYDETYDNSTGYMGDYSAHLGRDRGGRGDRGEGGRSTTPAHQNDARYTDMAPKYTRLGPDKHCLRVATSEAPFSNLMIGMIHFIRKRVLQTPTYWVSLGGKMQVPQVASTSPSAAGYLGTNNPMPAGNPVITGKLGKTSCLGPASLGGRSWFLLPKVLDFHLDEARLFTTPKMAGPSSLAQLDEARLFTTPKMAGPSSLAQVINSCNAALLFVPVRMAAHDLNEFAGSGFELVGTLVLSLS